MDARHHGGRARAYLAYMVSRSWECPISLRIGVSSSVDGHCIVHFFVGEAPYTLAFSFGRSLCSMNLSRKARLV